MDIKAIWTKLFSRNNMATEIALHSSGAAVRHRNPFENIEVQRNDIGPTQNFLDKWVAPFYMYNLSDADNETVQAFADASKEITVDIVKKLLGDFDWRQRITGARFAAIKNYKELDDIIGRHLLKSEVCYAGVGYCIALASFNTESAKKYLKTYLEYYLDRKDLWFDQADVFCALESIDKNASDELIGKWTEFVSDKPNWDLNKSRQYFVECMATLNNIRVAAKTI